MFSWLKKHFIPHEGNNHRPHILRARSIRNIIFIVLVLEAFTFLIPTLTKINNSGGMASVLPSILANLTNEERQAQKLDMLTVSPILNKAAEMKANDMATNGYFAHTSPEGKTPWYWLSQVGYKYQYAGENLAINFSDSKDVTSAWMASPTHRANIVKNKYTEVGTGIATGIYKGKETIFVAQVYANPLPKNETVNKVTRTKEGVKIETTTLNTNSKITTRVLGAETKEETKTTIDESFQTKEPTIMQNIFASPRYNTNKILFIVFGLIIISLILNIFIKIKYHHPDLITNGLITLAIIGAIFITNYYISHQNMSVTQSVDYSAQSVDELTF